MSRQPQRSQQPQLKTTSSSRKEDPKSSHLLTKQEPPTASVKVIEPILPDTSKQLSKIRSYLDLKIHSPLEWHCSDVQADDWDNVPETAAQIIIYL